MNLEAGVDGPEVYLEKFYRPEMQEENLRRVRERLAMDACAVSGSE